MNSLSLNINQNLAISPNIINSLKILQLNSLDLEQYLKDQLLDNPLLDMKINNTFKHSERKTFEEYTSETTCFRDYLFYQIGELKLTNKLNKILEILIYSIDDRGYLPKTFIHLSELHSYNVKEIQQARDILTNLEPLGVGATSLEECLILQLNEDFILYNICVKFINNYLYKLTDHSLEQISKDSCIDLYTIKDILIKIKSLNPIPSNGYSIKEAVNYIIPEAVIKLSSGHININFLNNDHISITIDPEYLNSSKTMNAETDKYIQENINKANYLIDSINKRNYTVNLVIKEIIDIQKDFFIKKLPLKALILKDISEKINLSISTVSRAIKDKYIETPEGMFEVKYFFSNSQYNLNSTSSNEIKNIIIDMISIEDKSNPLSDLQITLALNDLEIKISRRTIAKYRDQLNIESSYMRKFK